MFIPIVSPTDLACKGAIRGTLGIATRKLLQWCAATAAIQWPWWGLKSGRFVLPGK
jgi:hypothetical protein